MYILLNFIAVRGGRGGYRGKSQGYGPNQSGWEDWGGYGGAYGQGYGGGYGGGYGQGYGGYGGYAGGYDYYGSYGGYGAPQRSGRGNRFQPY